MSDFPISILIQQDHPTIKIQEDPEVIVVQYRCKRGEAGTDGTDGITPDLTDPSEIQKIMEALAGQITATELHQDLLTRINRIDLGPTSHESLIALLQYADSVLDENMALLGGRISLAEGGIEDIEALYQSVSAELSTLSGNYSALSTAMTGIESRVVANEDDIEATALQVTQLGVDLTSLDGTVTANGVATSQLSTRVTEIDGDIESFSNSLTALGSRVDDVESGYAGQAAIISQLSTDVAYVNGALTTTTQSIQTLSSSVVNLNNEQDTLEAAIQTEAVTRANQTGDLYAKYSLKVDVNGKISGFGLQSTDTASIFDIRADRFAFSNSSGSGTVFPFIIDNGIVYIDAARIKNATVTNAKIGTAAVDTLQVASNAITASDFSNFYYAFGITTQVTLLTVSIYVPSTAIGQRISCIFGAYGNASAGTLSFVANSGGIAINQLVSVQYTLFYGQSLSYIVSFAGTHTFTMTASDGNYSFGYAYAMLNKR